MSTKKQREAEQTAQTLDTRRMLNDREFEELENILTKLSIEDLKKLRQLIVITQLTRG